MRGSQIFVARAVILLGFGFSAVFSYAVIQDIYRSEIGRDYLVPHVLAAASIAPFAIRLPRLYKTHSRRMAGLLSIPPLVVLVGWMAFALSTAIFGFFALVPTIAFAGFTARRLKPHKRPPWDNEVANVF